MPHIFNFRVASIKYERVKTRFASCVACLAVAIVPSIATCTAHSASKDDPTLYTADELSAIYRHSPLGRLPPDPTNRVAEDPNAAALGQFLFFDSRFSANGAISCATCHNPALAFTDGRALSKGIAVGTRNVPTVLDVAFSQWFFLDGRTDSLWSQAVQPIENAAEFRGDRLQMVLTTIRDPSADPVSKGIRIFARTRCGSPPGRPPCAARCGSTVAGCTVMAQYVCGGPSRC